MRYIAFLRAINVGGTGIISMEDLRSLFSKAGAKEVDTYIQSGNVKFEAQDAKIVIKKVQASLNKRMGKEIAIIVRTIAELALLLKSRPKEGTDTEKQYVVLLETAVRSKVPLFSKNKDVEISSIIGKDALCISRQYKGKWGFPNKFVEDTFKIPATTRNWNTLEKIVLRWG
jgi:uncharacterized protein (DUF1697 family)